MTKPKPPERIPGAKPLPTPKKGGTYKAIPGEVPERIGGTKEFAPSSAKTTKPSTPPGDK